MLFPVSSWRQCSIKSMFYTLFLISLCAVLHVWMYRVILDFTDTINFTVSVVQPAANILNNHIYILSWDNKYITSKVAESFPKLNCPVKNCVFTTNKRLLNDLKAFKAIIFDESILNSENRPKERSSRQIFVFMSIASSYKYPACEAYNENFFNWTFTHRSDSDLLWRHYVVRNLSGTLVAPSKHVVWINNTDPLRSEVKSILRSKTRTVVWIVDNPSTKIYEYLMRLEKYLLYDFGMKLYKYKDFKKNSVYVDVLSQNYQFVLVFDHEYFMSKKLIEGYRNYAVPVVYSAMDYSRFVPPGSYINAHQMDPYDLARAINEASKNLTVYENYFKWTNVYSIEGSSPEHSPLCDLCAALYSNRTFEASATKNFRVLWNTPYNMSPCLPKDFLALEEDSLKVKSEEISSELTDELLYDNLISIV